MKINQRYTKEGELYLSLEEIYCNTVLRTYEGNEVAICMRDDTIEFNVIGNRRNRSIGNNWHTINMQTGEVSKL